MRCIKPCAASIVAARSSNNVTRRPARRAAVVSLPAGVNRHPDGEVDDGCPQALEVFTRTKTVHVTS
jgi:hypothetical protein